MRLSQFLDTQGGHLLVVLFVFLVGVGLVVARADLGKEVVVGSLASLWTLLQTQPVKDNETK